MAHICHIPHQIWEWAQDQSGKKNPASYLRELLWAAYIADIQGETTVNLAPAPEPEPVTVDPWLKYGLELEVMDPEFTKAREAFVVKSGSEDAALEWWDKAAARGINKPRAFLMDWYRKQGPA